MCKRDYHHKRAQKTKSAEEWLKYKELRNKTTQLIRNSKRNFYSNVIEKNKKDSSKLWKTLNTVTATTTKTSNIELLETDTGVVHDSREISRSFAKYFSSAITTLRQKLFSVLPTSRLRSTSRLANNIFELSEISETFISKELKTLKTHKSTGLTNVPPRLLKDGADVIAIPLAVLMNRSVNEGSIPSGWKHAIITPVHKSGLKSITSNYRPISVLPVFAKIQEKAVHKMIYDFLQKHKILSVCQSGFRPFHSTTTSLIDITNTIL